ncbi:MAG: GAF domain-containing protein [Candidatus Zixiibacteriota bacterium]|nr:MAG: GAF domain-containing protein [candidate division Zixibacteria bacterium]
MDGPKTAGQAKDPVGNQGAAMELSARTGMHERPAQLFFDLTRRLKTRFEISRGVLLLRSGIGGPLAAVSTWNNGQMREGLAIKLPSESSLFEKVAECGRVYTENFCGAFSGNFFERKLLVDEGSRSFVLQPLCHQGEVIGMIGYSSESPTAFTLFEEGAMDNLLAEFASVLRDQPWSA